MGLIKLFKETFNIGLIKEDPRVLEAARNYVKSSTVKTSMGTVHISDPNQPHERASSGGTIYPDEDTPRKTR